MEFLIINLITVITAIITSTSGLAYWLGRKFTEIDSRFDSLENRVSSLEDKVTHLENRVISLENELRNLGNRVNSLENRMNELENRMSKLESRMNSLEEKLSIEIKKAFGHVISFTQSIQYTLIDFMSMKGLFTKEERDFLIRDIERIGRIYLTTLNPLKPEEAKFILEVMKEIKEKDPKEIDLNKLDKIIEIARKWFEEEGHPDAARLMIETYMLKSILRKERGEL